MFASFFLPLVVMIAAFGSVFRVATRHTRYQIMSALKPLLHTLKNLHGTPKSRHDTDCFLAWHSLFTQSILISIFNLENIYYFPSCRGGTISLLHSFTPSLLHFPLDFRKPGRSSHMKGQGRVVGKFGIKLLRET